MRMCKAVYYSFCSHCYAPFLHLCSHTHTHAPQNGLVFIKLFTLHETANFSKHLSRVDNLVIFVTQSEVYSFFKFTH